MNTNKAERLAKGKIDEHGLSRKGWTFGWLNSRKVNGKCSYAPKKILLSKRIVSVSDEPFILDIILHEIAHALVGVGHGHGRVWKRKCIEIGAKPIRCSPPQSSTQVEKLQYKYTGTCPNCGATYGYSRKLKTSRACFDCCEKLAGGRYSDLFELTIVQNY